MSFTISIATKAYEHNLNLYATGRMNFAITTHKKPKYTAIVIAGAVKSGENSVVIPNAAQIKSCPRSSWKFCARV
jgi:hypothetical protein